jgi:hypothetical protein
VRLLREGRIELDPDDDAAYELVAAIAAGELDEVARGVTERLQLIGTCVT